MELDRETIIEAAAAALPVAIMIAILMVIGSTFAHDGGELSPTGGQAVVGAIFAFVVLMFVIGVYLSRIRPNGNGEGGSPNGS